MNKFKPHIIPVYPPHNELIFEEWFAENYKGCDTDRELLPVFPTSYWVNNNYAQDAISKQDAQDYIDSLPDKKYFVICQYDDGCLIDWKGKDVLEFNMSKQNGVMIPLICQPHPYKFKGPKKWLANFVGSATHPIRESAHSLKNKNGYYISFDRHDIESYCRIMHESIFTLCYRGYGINSFRIAESVQYGSIPVYISTGNDFILPSWMDFGSFGVIILEHEVDRIDEILFSIEPATIVEKQECLAEAYDKFYTYEANLKHIINYLERENASHNMREQV